MSLKLNIPIEISARHVHLSREDFETLFGKGAELTFAKELSQPGQFLAKERVDIVGPKGVFADVAVLGPFRKESQVELSITDTRRMGITHVIRQSGDIEGTPGCALKNGEKELELEKGVIVAKRHIHMTPEHAMRLNVKDNEEVFVVTESYDRSMIYGNVVVRVDDSFKLAMHIDTDEANSLAGDPNAFGVIWKLFEGDCYNIHMWIEELLWGINR